MTLAVVQSFPFHMKATPSISWLGFFAALYLTACASPVSVIPGTVKFPLPTVDLSADVARQVVVAQGTADVYQGHPTTILMPDGRTIYCVWTIGHGGPLGPLKRSDDGGKTWSDLLEVPKSWPTTRNCPTIYRLKNPQGVERLVVYAGQGAGLASEMHVSYSTDEGKTWSEMKSTGLDGVAMPFCAVTPVDGGKRLLGVTNIRRPGETKEERSNVLAQSFSSDGGLTWTPWKIYLDVKGLKPCEPELVRSPDGKQILCLIRENVKRVALYMTSEDEGKTWSEAKALPAGLYGDRHIARYLPDGRLVVCFRDTGKDSPTRNHFVAWVGTYADILAGRDGQYRVKLLHSYKGGDCGYPGVEVLPDGTVVATTYIKYREGPEKNSVVSTRFHPAETDPLAQRVKAVR
jgi:hypothetical protein